MPDGTGESQRIGRKITITGITLRLNIEFQAQSTSNSLNAAQTAHETLRLILYIDKQCNGAAATASEILYDVSQEGGPPVIPEYNEFRNLAHVRRFVILYDKLITFNSNAIGGAGFNVADVLVGMSERNVRDYQIKIHKKLFLPIYFSGTTGGLSEIQSNNIGLIVWTKHGARLAMLSSPCRIRYIDY